MRMLELLNFIGKRVTSDIDEWRGRNSGVTVAPFPADYPCYYCSLVDTDNFGKAVCRVCIHNPDAQIYELAKNEEVLREVYSLAKAAACSNSSMSKPYPPALKKMQEILK